MKKLTIKRIAKDANKIGKKSDTIMFLLFFMAFFVSITMLTDSTINSKILVVCTFGLITLVIIICNIMKIIKIKKGLIGHIKIQKDIVIDKKTVISKKHGKYTSGSKILIETKSGIRNKCNWDDGLQVTMLRSYQLKIGQECYVVEINIPKLLYCYVLYPVDKYCLPDELKDNLEKNNIKVGGYDENGIEIIDGKKLKVDAHCEIYNRDVIDENMIRNIRKQQVPSENEFREIFIYKDYLIDREITGKQKHEKYELHFENYSDRTGETICVSKEIGEKIKNNQCFYLIRFSGEKHIYQLYPEYNYVLDEKIMNRLQEWDTVIRGNFYKTVELGRAVIDTL